MDDDYAAVPRMAQAFSAYLDSSYPSTVDVESRLWRRVTKVDEETGEVQQALRAYLGENPRKPIGPMEDLIKELCDVAACAMGALEHVTGNQGRSLALIAERLRFTCERAAVDVPPFDVDGDGDCAACGHAVWLHTLAGCCERVHGANLDETTCDCKRTNPSLDGFDGGHADACGCGNPAAHAGSPS